MLSLKDLLDLYEHTKREKADHTLYYYRKADWKMVSYKEASKDKRLGLQKTAYYPEQEIGQRLAEIGYAPFINSYEVFMKCVNKFLKEVGGGNTEKKIKSLENDKNYVGKILHILDCGYYQIFDDYETEYVIRIIKKWCRDNDIPCDNDRGVW